mgnify:CR=1 FL=1
MIAVQHRPDIFGLKALNQVCKIEDLDYIITDEKTDKKILREIKEKGVQIKIV